MKTQVENKQKESDQFETIARKQTTTLENLENNRHEWNKVAVTEKFWALYSQDFRCMKFTSNKTKTNLAQNFKKLNPL